MKVSRIELERRIQDMSKADLSRRMGINPTTLHELLSGRKPWTDYYRQKAGEVLGIDAATLDQPVTENAR